MDIYVATKSKARKELLRNIGLEYKELEVDFEEKTLDDPVETVRYNSMGKHRLATENVEGIVITFDTVIHLDDEVLGKPGSYEEAYKMLKKLSGREHYVYTGLVLGDRERRVFGYDKTRVKFIELDDEMIKWYLWKERYWEFAGGYRIQGRAALFIDHIDGDFFNVVGVPIKKLLEIFREYGLDPLKFLR